MSVWLDRQRDTWVDYIVHATTEPTGSFPYRDVMRLADEAFAASVAWNWLEPDGSIGGEMLHAPSEWPPPGNEWFERMPDHPVVRWLARTGDIRAMTIERVPEAVADRCHVEAIRRHLGSPDVSQQLCIPVCLGSRSHRTLILSKGGRDFTDRQVELARSIQPLLMVLHQQTVLLGRSSLAPSLVQDHGLTGRETAVLTLLAEGRTAESIGHHLMCSPRTVHKHLEHTYRKLGVTDRLGAARIVDAYAPRGTGTLLVRPRPVPADEQLPPDTITFSGTLNLESALFPHQEEP